MKQIIVAAIALLMCACTQRNLGICTITDKHGAGGFGSPPMIVSMTCDSGLAYTMSGGSCVGHRVGARVNAVYTLEFMDRYDCRLVEVDDD